VGKTLQFLKSTHSKLNGGGKLFIATECATVFDPLFKNNLVAGQTVV